MSNKSYRLEKDCLKYGVKQCGTKRMYNVSRINDDDNSEVSESDGARQYVKNLMSTWKLDPELRLWCYHIEFLNKIKGKSSDHCLYEVKWTKPMEGLLYPILAINIYVFISVNSKTADLISMKYAFEGNKFIHDAYSVFNPHWLCYAYENKKAVIDSLNCPEREIIIEEKDEIENLENC